ncbi:MAG: molybdenum cofactor biosynthesis protein B [Spirochaetaceae bacterium]
MAAERALSIMIITVSDRAAAGVYQDRSGPAVEEELLGSFPDCRVERRIVPDEPEPLRAALESGGTFDVVLTTGGTGLGPRDITPEVTKALCDRELPGIAEMLRFESRKEVPTAILSRGVAGSRGRSIYVNLPGSVNGARSCTRMLLPILEHAVEMVAGGDH